MSALKSILVLFFFLIVELIGIQDIKSAPISFKNYYSDTSNIIIRICHGIPGHKDTDAYYHYTSTVCAYEYNSGKPQMYEVISFDLLYRDEKSKVARTLKGKGNFLNSDMKYLLAGVDSLTAKNVFLENVKFVNMQKDTIISKGPIPLEVIF